MASPDAFLFNGDADGIIGQHILELHLGAPRLRVTGWKRDIELLRKLPPLPADQPAEIHVLDISLDKNRLELDALLAQGNVKVTWYDHHDPGTPPVHPNLTLHVNQAAGTCTAAIVHAVCGRGYPLWAAMAAFGDNLPVTGEALLKDAGLAEAEWDILKRSGVLINYNAYGEKPGDLLFEPSDLARRVSPFASALEFCREESIFKPLAEQFEHDRARFHGLKPLLDAPRALAFLMPDEPWARRYGATWANERILAEPHEALAILHAREDGSYMVSIRAPRASGDAPTPGQARSAADLAKEFPTGGGRRSAAGINALPAADLDRFLDRFRAFFEA